jgi:hypothetical protein
MMYAIPREATDPKNIGDMASEVDKTVPLWQCPPCVNYRFDMHSAKPPDCRSLLQDLTQILINHGVKRATTPQEYSARTHGATSAPRDYHLD